MTISGVPPASAAGLRSARMAAMTRRAIRPLMQHSYSRRRPVPVLDQAGDPTRDELNQPVTAPGPPSAPLPCLYESRTHSVADASGRRVIVEPVLSVFYDDDVEDGDEIVEVLDLDGRAVLRYGVVDRIDPLAEPGGLVLKELALRDVIVVKPLPPDGDD